MTSKGTGKMIQTIIGVDIAKDTLDAHHLDRNESRRFANTTSGHKALIGWIGTTDARLVFEPTGPYHRAFERRLADAGCALVKVNPRRARRFAEAMGVLAKTDRIDAALLARMGAMLALEPAVTHPVLLSDLKQLLVARDALVKDRTAAKNRAKTVTLGVLKRQLAQRLRQIARQMHLIEDEIAALIASDRQLARKFAILTSIPGISQVTAFALIIDMPELGMRDGKKVASLAGLAPMTRQSGRWKGKAFITGGRAQLRQALYMPALVATRFNPDLKAKYDALRRAGKPAKIAITAIMRKIIVLANALIRQDRLWERKHA